MSVGRSLLTGWAVCMEYGVHICISAGAVGEQKKKENKEKEKKSELDRMPINGQRRRRMYSVNRGGENTGSRN